MASKGAWWPTELPWCGNQGRWQHKQVANDRGRSKWAKVRLCGDKPVGVSRITHRCGTGIADSLERDRLAPDRVRHVRYGASLASFLLANA